MQLLSSDNQDSFRFDNVGIGNTTVYRTHCGARFMVVEAYALSTFFRYDVEDAVGDRGMIDPV